MADEYTGDERRDIDEHLTREEIGEIRRIIEHDRRATWLWASIRNVSVWIAAVIVGIGLAYDSLVSVLKHLVGK